MDARVCDDDEALGCIMIANEEEVMAVEEGGKDEVMPGLGTRID